jgi:acetyltransferase-like isoleucine patch superfamily enzyme
MTNAIRETLKAVARPLATAIMVPALCSFYIRRSLVGGDRALLASTQAQALIPGLLGQYLRRAFLARVLAHCAPTAVIEWGTLFSDTGTRLDDHVYIGPNCHIGLCHIERDVLVGPCVHIPSGRVTHGIGDPDQPIRDQIGERTQVRIGANSWIGSAAVVMASIGPATVVGAGAVVTRELPGHVIAAGVPARVVRARPTAAEAARAR